MPWTDWQLLKTPSNHLDAAVYQMRILTDRQCPIPIPRFLGTDKEGLLCIGATGNMERRRKNLLRGILRCSGHSEGNLLHLLLRYSRLRQRFPKHQLEYRYCAEADEAAAKTSETRLIKAYVRKFGEAPPLNSAIPDRYGNWDV